MSAAATLSAAEALAFCRDVLAQCPEAPAVLVGLLEGRRVCGKPVLSEGRWLRHSLSGRPIGALTWMPERQRWHWEAWYSAGVSAEPYPSGDAETWREADAALVELLQRQEPTWVCEAVTPLDGPLQERDPETLTESERRALEGVRQRGAAAARPWGFREPYRITPEQWTRMKQALQKARITVEPPSPPPAVVRDGRDNLRVEGNTIVNTARYSAPLAAMSERWRQLVNARFGRRPDEPVPLEMEATVRFEWEEG